jgi:hypothetical protein
MASYAGISGAERNTGNYLAQRWREGGNCCDNNQCYGRHSGSGMLVNRISIKMGDCTDGTSNVMILGEGSDWCYQNNGVRRHCDPSWPHGWPMGSAENFIVEGTNSSRVNRTFNLTSVRWPVGENRYGRAGICENHGPNNPINSAHPGGAMICLVDGSNRFISNDIKLETLKALADRDDGLPLPQF